MLRARYMLMTLALALVPVGCTPMGCSGEDPDQDRPAAEQAEGLVPAALPAPVPGKSLYGTWAGDTAHQDMFAKLVLMNDGRYHGERNVQCITAPCPPIGEDGTFKLYTRDMKTFLELVATGTGHTDKYEYTMRDEKLAIRLLRPGTEFFTMARSNQAWCAIERDCVGQVLPPGPCAGSYTCGKNVCAWTCTQADPAAAVVAPPSDATRPSTCPAVADCIISTNACDKTPRDKDACTKADECKKCYPNGLDPKNLPVERAPIENPVLR